MDLSRLSNIIHNISPDQVSKLKHLVLDASEIVLIGNGGSNAIASHMAIDYTKFFGKRCYVPHASDMLSMMVNDYGAENMYSKFIEYNHNPNQLVILISSSGNSLNIINAARKCDELKIPIVLLSGFDPMNKLNLLEYNNIEMVYWVDSSSYGEVEMAHHIFLHSIIEA
jgi:D-sedoheptulose 7-phosphate isomerase